MFLTFKMTNISVESNLFGVFPLNSHAPNAG